MTDKKMTQEERIAFLERELEAEKRGRSREQLSLHLMFKDLAQVRRYLSNDKNFLAGRVETLIAEHALKSASTPPPEIKILKDAVFERIQGLSSLTGDVLENERQSLEALIDSIRALQDAYIKKSFNLAADITMCTNKFRIKFEDDLAEMKRSMELS